MTSMITENDNLISTELVKISKINNFLNKTKQKLKSFNDKNV